MFTRYACKGGSVSVDASLTAFLRTDIVTVTPMVGDTAQAPVSITPGAPATKITVPIVATDGQCQARFVVSSTVVPAQLNGSLDTRALGVLLENFEYHPPA